MPFEGFEGVCDVDVAYEKMIRHAAKIRGYSIHEDALERVIQGLIKRKDETGFATCPCIIKPDVAQARLYECPCVQLDSDIAKKGQCRCKLFYKEVKNGE